MKHFFTYFFTITIFIQPVTALAVDYSDFDSHCQSQWQNELELIKKEVEEGELTESEAEEEIDYMSPMVDQCVCYYQKLLEGAGADIVLYGQKVDIIQMNDDYTDEEIKKLEIPKHLESLDFNALLISIEKACGIDPE